MSVARSLPVLILLGGCASRPLPVAEVAPAPLAVAPAPPAPLAAGIRIPARLPDGGYATPNRMASPAGAIWHLRAGLNVAALACRDADAAALTARYNAFLAAHAREFAAAYRTLGDEYGTPASFDAAMTMLYNYYALPPAQPGLCAAAGAVLADAGVIPAGGLAGFAPGALARLDAPYVALFAAQDSWTAGRFAARAPATLALAAAGPNLRVDPAVLVNP